MTSTPNNSNFETQVLERLTRIEAELEYVKTDTSSVKEEFNGWTTRLRFVSGTILFSLAITLLGLVLPSSMILFGLAITLLVLGLPLVLALGIALWRQSLT